MKKAIKYYANLFFVFCIVATVVSCASNQKKENNDNIKVNDFVPNPQLMEEQEHETLTIGSEAPDFTLPNMSGKMVSLSDFSNAKVLVVVFICVHCLTAQAYEERLIQFTEDYKNKGVRVVAIMPNSNLGLSPEELGYTEYDDSYKNMKKRAKDKNFNFPFLYDGDDR